MIQIQALGKGADVRLLLVDDHELNRVLLSDYLSYVGYNILGLESGEAFFPTLEEFQPHLILLDLKLQGKNDGYTLLQQLQQSSQWHSLPVFIVSALVFEVDRKRAMSLGARRYFTKPIDLDALVEAIYQEVGC